MYLYRMSILRSCRRDVLCHDANVAMRRICLINARAREHAMSHEAAAIMRCMRFNERACRQIRENVSTSLQRYRFSERSLGNGGRG